MEKRKVTMTSISAVMGPKGEPLIEKREAVDYVPVDQVDAYVADAQTRWQHVEVGTKNDHGPGGVKGDTNIPEHLEAGITLDEHLAKQEG